MPKVRPIHQRGGIKVKTEKSTRFQRACPPPFLSSDNACGRPQMIFVIMHVFATIGSCPTMGFLRAQCALFACRVSDQWDVRDKAIVALLTF